MNTLIIFLIIIIIIIIFYSLNYGYFYNKHLKNKPIKYLALFNNEKINLNYYDKDIIKKEIINLSNNIILKSPNL